MAGVVFDALARRPEAGEVVEVAGTRLTVEELDGAPIARLRVELSA